MKLYSVLAEKKGVIAITDGDGALVLTSSDQPNILDDSLELGRNILEGTSNFDYTDRFLTYIIKGKNKTTGSGWSQRTISVKANVFDEGINRFRTLLVDASGVTSISEAEEEGYWEFSKRIWNSTTSTIVVKGFRQSNKELWPVNSIIKVNADKLSLSQYMLIVGVTYTLDVGGSKTALELAPVGAFRQKVERVKVTDSPKGTWG